MLPPTPLSLTGGMIGGRQPPGPCGGGGVVDFSLRADLAPAAVAPHASLHTHVFSCPGFGRASRGRASLTADGHTGASLRQETWLCEVLFF